jgi:hypothetical protein
VRDVVVILHAEAIPGAQRICAGLSDYEVFLFDPHLGDPAAAAGLHNVELFTTLGGASHQEMDHDAHAAALAWESDIDAEQRPLSGVSIIGWQHLNLYYFFMAVQWYEGLWERVGPRFSGRKVHVFLNDNPAEYYFNSFLPAVSLATFLQNHGIEFDAYNYGAKNTPAYPVPDLDDRRPNHGPLDLLTHVPTCYYDLDFFRDEIRMSGRRTISFESKQWHRPIEAQVQIGLVGMEDALPRLLPAVHAALEAAVPAISQALTRLLSPLMSLPTYCARQVAHWTQSYRAQLITYFELQRYFGDNPPAKFLLSEHDTGFHGPLIGFAAQRAIPVLLVPHSKVSADLEFLHPDLTVLTHPIQCLGILGPHGDPVASAPIIYPERFSSSSSLGDGIKTLSLLLNAMTLNGVPYAPCDTYFDGVARIVGWCRLNLVTLKIRCKPDYPITRVLGAYAGADSAMLAGVGRESLDQHLSDCDVCLMYDLPTTAAMACLRDSVVLLNPMVTAPTKAFAAIAHPEVCAMESVEATLERLDGFMRDPLEFYRFRAAQFRAYVERFKGARALRSYL